MKIGYPCINNSIPHTSPSTFRLASYSEDKLTQTVIGDYIRHQDIRISMHPDQFVILNSPNDTVLKNSINELRYHSKILDAMRLDTTAKVQIHVGGVYGNKIEAIDRFVKTYNNNSLIDDIIKRRLVIENDDHLFNLMDCLKINKQTGIPIIFDSFHHELFCNGEPLRIALREALLTWKKKADGSAMVDYSSSNSVKKEDSKGRKGKHAETIDVILFKKFLEETEGLDFDIMLEIKDKEKSALGGLKVVKELGINFAVVSAESN
jgi:UV DNA damage endonuclease